jgi:hypothetical protein
MPYRPQTQILTTHIPIPTHSPCPRPCSPPPRRRRRAPWRRCNSRNSPSSTVAGSGVVVADGGVNECGEEVGDDGLVVLEEKLRLLRQRLHHKV